MLLLSPQFPINSILDIGPKYWAIFSSAGTLSTKACIIVLEVSFSIPKITNRRIRKHNCIFHYKCIFAIHLDTLLQRPVQNMAELTSETKWYEIECNRYHMFDRLNHILNRFCLAWDSCNNMQCLPLQNQLKLPHSCLKFQLFPIFTVTNIDHEF